MIAGRREASERTAEPPTTPTVDVIVPASLARRLRDVTAGRRGTRACAGPLEAYATRMRRLDRTRRPRRRRATCAVALALLFGAITTGAPALADTVIGAKVQCQGEYGSASQTADACERGVDLAARTPGNLPLALGGCTRDAANADKAMACRRGVALYAQLGTRGGEAGSSSFAYSWKQGHGAAQVEIGEVDLLIGDAEKSMGDCMRSFEGAKTPPSCLSGLRLQTKPPATAR